VHLGNCDIGCDVRARNTLDLNYLARAEQQGAEVRPLHQVTTIAPDAAGYRVSFNQIGPAALVPGAATARLVIVAAGSLGSTELLLRCRDVHQTLPNLSAQLGIGWSSNGDFLTPAIHPLRPVKPSRGPTITAAIDMLDGSAYGQDVFIEDGGLPDLASGLLGRLTAAPPTDPLARLIVESLRPLLAANMLTEHVMPWFAQSRDAADGVFTLKNGRLNLAWNIAKSKATIDAVVRLHQELAAATGGMALTPLPWAVAQSLITPHPLGGCRLGTTAGNGVVAHNGEVFGYPNLFVADGAIVPKAIGLNPSRTIGALAERIAKIIVTDGR
jgi:cholesterol oxidase